MQCPKCGRNVPDHKERCLYCGTKITKDFSATDRETKKTGGMASSLHKRDKIVVTNGTTGEVKIYESLKDIPVSLRQKKEKQRCITA